MIKRFSHLFFRFHVSPLQKIAKKSNFSFKRILLHAWYFVLAKKFDDVLTFQVSILICIIVCERSQARALWIWREKLTCAVRPVALSNKAWIFLNFSTSMTSFCRIWELHIMTILWQFLSFDRDTHIVLKVDKFFKFFFET